MKPVFSMLSLMTLAVMSAAEEKAPPSFPVPLNHFYLALDPDTYAAIEGSNFLQKEFAVFERRTTVRTDKTYTGIYFYGVHTYFEFFDASKQTEFQQDRSGIAFAVEQPGALKSLQARLTGSPPELITRQEKGVQIPWFYMLDLERYFRNSVLDSWVMEYHPGFLAQWRPEAGKTRTGILREEILQRYKEVLRDAPSQPLFGDVIGLTLAADGASISTMRQLGESFGYAVTTDGEATVLQGPDIVLHLIPETTSCKMVKLRIIFVLGLCSISLARAELSPFEQKVIGTWEFTGTEATVRIVLRVDHTCATLNPVAGRRGWKILAKGAWLIDGDYLIRAEKPFVPGAASGPSVISKLRIRWITRDRFHLGGGRPMTRVE